MTTSTSSTQAATVEQPSFGRIGFDAYGNHPGPFGEWATFDGRPIPGWEELGIPPLPESGNLTRDRWEAAAAAIIVEYERRKSADRAGGLKAGEFFVSVDTTEAEAAMARLESRANGLVAALENAGTLQEKLESTRLAVTPLNSSTNQFSRVTASPRPLSDSAPPRTSNLRAVTVLVDTETIEASHPLLDALFDPTWVTYLRRIAAADEENWREEMEEAFISRENSLPIDGPRAVGGDLYHVLCVLNQAPESLTGPRMMPVPERVRMLLKHALDASTPERRETSERSQVTINAAERIDPFLMGIAEIASASRDLAEATRAVGGDGSPVVELIKDVTKALHIRVSALASPIDGTAMSTSDPRAEDKALFKNVEVRVTPAARENDTALHGIVVMGIREEADGLRHTSVLERLSPQSSEPTAWVMAAVDAVHRWEHLAPPRETSIVVVSNTGGSMIESLIRQVDGEVMVKTLLARAHALTTPPVES